MASLGQRRLGSSATSANSARLKELPGKNIYVVGGPTLVANLLNAGLIDELRLIVHPLILGGGKALFENVRERRSLQFVHAEQTSGGRVILSYRT